MEQAKHAGCQHNPGPALETNTAISPPPMFSPHCDMQTWLIKTSRNGCKNVLPKQIIWILHRWLQFDTALTSSSNFLLNKLLYLWRVNVSHLCVPSQLGSPNYGHTGSSIIIIKWKPFYELFQTTHMRNVFSSTWLDIIPEYTGWERKNTLDKCVQHRAHAIRSHTQCNLEPPEQKMALFFVYFLFSSS